MQDNYDPTLSSKEVCELLGVSRAGLSLQRKHGRGPVFEILDEEYSEGPTRYGYKLSAVLAYLEGKGRTKAQVAVVRRQYLMKHKFALGRAADRARGEAAYACRMAQTAARAAAAAGNLQYSRLVARGGPFPEIN